MANQGALDPA
jgi:hypothetical protein